MVDFYAVTDAVDNWGGWETFLTNMEDGFVIWQNDEYPGYELVFADWDMYGGGEIRMVDPTKENSQTGYYMTVMSRNLDGLNEDEAAIAVEEFFEDLADLLA